MPDFKPPRPGEIEIAMPRSGDAHVHFIGEIRTPWSATADCPKSSRVRTDVEAQIVVDPRYAPGLKDVELYSHLIVLYWLHKARRDLVEQVPSHLSRSRGVFALRSPVRPNPIGLAVVELVRVETARLIVRNLDCVDRTPLVDIKPYYASLDSEPHARRPP